MKSRMKGVQEEVKRRRTDPTILGNSVPGDGRSKRAAERAVNALGEHVRVLRAGLQERFGLVIRASHPVMTWLVQRAAESAHERLNGKPFSKHTPEFGEKLHYKRSNKGRNESEEYFLGLILLADLRGDRKGWDNPSCWSSSSLGR